MFTQRHYPRQLAHEKLDEYLDKGWFRMGQMIFTCQFLCIKNNIYSTVWIRLDLQQHQFKKSHRKLMKRNAKLFNIIIRKAFLSEEKEALYQMHKGRFSGYISENLEESLSGGAEYNIYDTYEVCIYDKEQLIAVSFFDIGQESIASIKGLFHPDYAQYSLGFHTMLLEMEYGIKEHKTYYYPGYIVSGYPSFDYKMRIGNFDYYDTSLDLWQAFTKLEKQALPAERLQQKLAEMADCLQKWHVPHQLLLYPLYDRQLFGHNKKSFIKHPLFISCFPNQKNTALLVIEYDLVLEVYRLSLCLKFSDLLSLFYDPTQEGFSRHNTCAAFVSNELIILESSQVEEIAWMVLKSVAPEEESKM